MVEDHISALLTKDKNKLAVYLDHYDGHCLRAYSYWKESMPDITEQLDKLDTTEQIYKVTYDDGSVKYLTESEIKELQK